MEITKREIIASITIVAIMFIIGFFISDKITKYEMDANEKYNKALKIDNEDVFKYCMKTNTGNAFVYGTLKAIDEVSFAEIEDTYLYIEKVKEKYTRHTRTRTYTVNGKTKTKIEVYYSWDYAGKEVKKSEKVNFLGVDFSSSKFELPSATYIKTIKESSDIRYKYYVISKEFSGTIFADLRNDDIGDKVSVYKDMDINETVEYVQVRYENALFWFMWVFVTGFVVYGFIYLDNEWLNK